jgi:hypothetical protein
VNFIAHVKCKIETANKCKGGEEDCGRRESASQSKQRERERERERERAIAKRSGELKAIQYISDLHVKNSGNERDLLAQNGTRDGTQKSRKIENRQDESD